MGQIDSDKKDSKNLFFKAMILIVKFFKFLIVTMAQVETRKNIRYLKGLIGTYIGKFEKDYKITLEKQKTISLLGPLFIIHCVLCGQIIGAKISIDKLFYYDSGCKALDCLVKSFRLESIAGHGLDWTLLSSLGASILMFFMLLAWVEKNNSVTLSRRYFVNVLKEVEPNKEENIEDKIDVIFTDGVGVYINSKKISSEAILNNDELWRTLNMDTGHIVKNIEVKSAFYINIAFHLPKVLPYDFKNIRH